jgi:hypothetical protein
MYRPLSGITFAAIDCGSFDAVCEKLEGISSPSVRYFAPSEKVSVKYEGVREVGPMSEWVSNVTQMKPYTAAGSLLFVSPGEVERIIGEGGSVFVVVDNHKVRGYNHTEIRQCEGQREIQFRALSSVDFPKESARYCEGGGNCIFLATAEEKVMYTGEVSTAEITAFLEAQLPPEL